MSTQLEIAVKALGLPKASAEAASKSPSQLSAQHMASVGWHVDLDYGYSPTELWDGLLPKMIGATTRFAKSDPTAIADQIKQIAICCNETVDDARDTQALKICLHYYVMVTGNTATTKLVRWIDHTKRNAANVAAYPHVDFVFDESPAKKIKEAALVSLLSLGPIDVPDSTSQNICELTVERVVGSAISGIFYSGTNNVHIASGQKLNAPSISRPTMAIAFPDIGAVCAGGQHNHIEPVVIFGEGKVKRRGLSLDGKPKTTKLSSRAQMAAAVHPTLILLVLAHYNRNKLPLQ